jgi:excisionase family DNA binding protein
MNTFDESTPLALITVGQLLEIIEQKTAARQQEPKPEPEPKDDRTGIDEIKQLTGLSYSQLYKLTANNAIPHRKFGKKLVFSLKAITTWMEQQTTGKETSKQKAARQLAKLAMKRTKNG